MPDLPRSGSVYPGAWLCAAGALLCAVTFADLRDAIGDRVSYGYIVPVVLALLFARSDAAIALAGIAIALIGLGAWLAPSPALVDRALVVTAIVLLVAVVRHQARIAARLRHDLQRAEADRVTLEASLQQAQKLETLGLLASGIAHDLNNILLPVTMLAPLLLEPSDTGDNRQSVQIIISSARRAKELVREMLLFSRKEQGMREAIRLDRLVCETRAMLRAGIPSSIAIVERLDAVPAISGSNGQLYQVVLNLATNAAEAIGTRAGTITIGTESRFDAEIQRETVHFYVADDGEGMDQATLDRAFDPFFSTKDHSDGTGIGLSTVRGIVKSHGGSISARSARGKGARFDLLFPALQPEQTT